jgi:hypothetical protein
MEGNFLFFLEDQLALVGPDAVQLDSIHVPLYTSCSVIERERDDSIIRTKAPPTHTALSKQPPWPPPHLSQLST